MFAKILIGLILLGLIGAFAYIALVDINIPQDEVVIEIDAKPSN